MTCACLGRVEGSRHMPEITLTAGPVAYEDTGGDGPVVVLLHGLVHDHTVWR
ncbi:hypothetical protein SY2F82_18110 [Streptomyces sp. Y2F8-2]|nr:hypothetical protein SY2F82_18110 [Streptomyces sp. Y2F8-2]